MSRVVELVSSLDKVLIDVPCQKCGFYISFYFIQAFNNEIIICGGCKRLLRLMDYMDECKTARRNFEKKLKELKRLFSKFGR